jgi:iron complex outermembrane receptor protein
VYASFTRGYKAAIENLGARSTTPIEPESISAYEVGYKYAASPFSLDLSSFYYNYKDLQVSSISNFVTNITNAARSRIYGLEGQLRYEVASGFEVTAGGAYLNAKYTSFPNAPSYNPCFSLPACGPAYGLLVPTSTDSSGLTLERAPKFTGTASALYSTGVLGGKLGLSLNAYYTSRVYFDTADQFSQPQYTLLGLRAEWTNRSGRYTVAVHGENVTDRHYVNQVLPEIGANAGWGPPAMVTGELRMHF